MSEKKEELLREIGQRVRKMRLSKDIQQVQLAEEFQCAQSRISGIEKGDRDPGTDFYYWFAKRTGCSLDYIIRGEENQRSISEDTVSHNEAIKNAVKSLVDAVLESEEVEQFLEDKNLAPAKDEFDGGLLTPSEINVIKAIREMSVNDSVAAMDCVLNFKSD